MVTLKKVLTQNGINYNTIFKHRAEDIYFDSNEELFESLGYILTHYKRFDFEIPEDHKAILGAYQIANGSTSGGNAMKYANQYRIYFNTTKNMPAKLHKRLQNDEQMRITGSLFIEACSFLGFEPGRIQDCEKIERNIRNLIHTQTEEIKFNEGKNL